ncbi:hypothetical protein MKW98_011419 [Papaver atlanticum]|uniref:Phytosulfokine n=1 Tax=Papaver atlanticum TaxID=357466 RepID=A0AAD4XGH3_9MAGN|nr:hypothetical protein MKW98_011419 [Papaver atlanticum]
MKQSINIYGVLVLLFLLISCFTTTTSGGRLLLEKQGEDLHDTNLTNGLANTDLLESEEKDTWKLLGMEDCHESGDEKEEECLKRRMMAEAHLDYIYTQHHKP